MKPGPDEDRIAELLAELYDAGHENVAQALEAAIEAHPDIADDLRSHVAMLGLVSEAFGGPDAVDPGLPSAIGGYEILDVLGRGGMATVYRAVQHEPIQREVAVKVLDRQLEGAHALARFEVEREALSRMNHTHIASVLDAGFTEGNRPFVVMELVDGEPITDYCERLDLDIEARLALFVGACEAIQYAHQKGVIHRDIKPSNVLVSDADGVARAKIIDFGLAKSMDGAFSMDATLTAMGQILGTPAYMSPEQAAGGDIDATTDVYGLGMLLYELLVGETAWDRDSLTHENFAVFIRRLAEEDPPRPSERLSTLHGERVSSSPTWERRLRGELDWITMKALARERERRYRTPGSLAEDVGRFLRHEPIEAGPPTTGYRVRKFVQRHLAGVIGAASVVAALVLGLGLSLHLYGEADDARLMEAEAREEADAALEYMLVDLHNGLQEVGVVHLLEGVAARTLAHADNYPPRFRRRGHMVRARALTNVADVLRVRGRWDEAARAYGHALEALDAVFAVDPADRSAFVPKAAALMGLAHAARQLGDHSESKKRFQQARSAADMYKSARHVPWIADQFHAIQLGLADAAFREHRMEEALAYVRTVLESDHASAMQRAKGEAQLAQIQFATGRPAESRAAHQRAVKAAREVLAKTPSSFVGRYLLGQGLCLVALTSPDYSSSKFKVPEEGLAILSALHRDFPAREITKANLAQQHANVARALVKTGKIEAASPHVERSMELALALRDDAPTTAGTWEVLFSAHFAAQYLAIQRQSWQDCLRHGDAGIEAHAEFRRRGTPILNDELSLSEALYGNAQAHVQLKNPKRARRAARAAVKLRLKVESLRGEAGGAAVISRDVANAQSQLVTACLMDGDLPAAAAVAKELLARVPEDADASWQFSVSVGGTALVLAGEREAKNNTERSSIAGWLANMGMYKQALELYRGILRDPQDAGPLAPATHYNAACAAARASESAQPAKAEQLRKTALGWLATEFTLRRAALQAARAQEPAPADLPALEARHAYIVKHAKRGDPDLASLRSMPGFAEIFAGD